MAKSKKTSPETWKSRYELAQNSQERMFNKFQSWYDLFYAHINTSQYALWRSKVFLPIIPAKAKEMIAKLQSLNPGWEIGLYGDALLDDSAQDKAEKAQWKLEHDWDNPNFDEPMRDKLFSPLMDAVITGTGIAKVPWCFGDAIRYEKYSSEDTGEIDLTKDVKIKTSRGYNDLIPHDIMSTYIAPGAKNLYSAPWVILEDWVTYEQLEDENEASGGQLYDAKELAKAKDLKTETDRFSTQKQSRDLVVTGEDPLEVDTTVTQLKRLECYEKSSGLRFVYAVGTGADGEETFVELCAKPNVYWHGKYPLVSFYITRRPHSFWGQGIFEDTERLQSAFNDLFNHYMDNLNLSLDGMLMYPNGETAPDFVTEPGGLVGYDATKPEPIQFPEPNANSFGSVMSMIEKQVEDATISSYATGSPNSATDSTSGTATGIMRLQEAAGDKLANMKSQFANSLREVGRQWLSNNQQFLDRPFPLMGQVDSRPAPVVVNPEDLQGEMILRINDASMEPTTREQAVTQFNAYVQQLLQLQQSSIQQAQMTKWTTQPVYLDFMSIVQDLSQKMGLANFEKILLAQDEVDKAMQASQSPMVMPNERINIVPADLLPSEISQLLQRNGIEPDPSRAQGALPPSEQVMASDTANTNAQASLTQNETKQQLEAAKIGLQANQQDHQQGKDAAEFLLKVHQQDYQHNQDAMNGQEVPAAAGAGGSRQAAPNPSR